MSDTASAIKAAEAALAYAHQRASKSKIVDMGRIMVLSEKGSVPESANGLAKR